MKSVSTAIEQVERHPDTSDHPVFIYPVWCRVCEYDEEGNCLKRGQIFEGSFVGDTTRYVRNEDGTIREKVLMNEKGQPFQRITLGPFGKMDEEDYLEGVLQDRQTFHYDESGNLIEWLTFDANGNETASTTATFDEEGNVTEQFDRGPANNFLHFTKHFNPDTGAETFTNYNEDGTVRLTFTDKDNHITNYWQQPSDKHEYGSGVCFNTAPKERQCESHYPDGTIWHQVEKFADERWRNPLRIELRDETHSSRVPTSNS